MPPPLEDWAHDIPDDDPGSPGSPVRGAQPLELVQALARMPGLEGSSERGSWGNTHTTPADETWRSVDLELPVETVPELKLDAGPCSFTVAAPPRPQPQSDDDEYEKQTASPSVYSVLECPLDVPDRGASPPPAPTCSCLVAQLTARPSPAGAHRLDVHIGVDRIPRMRWSVVRGKPRPAGQPRARQVGRDASKQYAAVPLPKESVRAVSVVCGDQFCLFVLQLAPGSACRSAPIVRTKPALQNPGVSEAVRNQLLEEVMSLMVEKWEKVWHTQSAAHMFLLKRVAPPAQPWRAALKGPMKKYMNAKRKVDWVRQAVEHAEVLKGAAETAEQEEAKLLEKIRKKQQRVSDERESRRRMQLKEELRKLVDSAAYERDVVDQYREACAEAEKRQASRAHMLQETSAKLVKTLTELSSTPLMQRCFERWVVHLAQQQRRRRIQHEAEILADGDSAVDPVQLPQPAGLTVTLPPEVAKPARRHRAYAAPFNSESGTLQLRVVPDMEKLAVGVVAAGPRHAIMLTDDGVWCYGSPLDGRLGAGSPIMRSVTPPDAVQMQLRPPASHSACRRIVLRTCACGARHSLVHAEVERDGLVWGCGWAGDGQLGDALAGRGELRTPEVITFAPPDAFGRYPRPISVMAGGRCSLVWTDVGVFLLGGGAPTRMLHRFDGALVVGGAMTAGACAMTTRQLPDAEEEERTAQVDRFDRPRLRLWAWRWDDAEDGAFQTSPARAVELQVDPGIYSAALLDPATIQRRGMQRRLSVAPARQPPLRSISLSFRSGSFGPPCLIICTEAPPATPLRMPKFAVNRVLCAAEESARAAAQCAQQTCRRQLGSLAAELPSNPIPAPSPPRAPMPPPPPPNLHLSAALPPVPPCTGGLPPPCTGALPAPPPRASRAPSAKASRAPAPPTGRAAGKRSWSAARAASLRRFGLLGPRAGWGLAGAPWDVSPLRQPVDASPPWPCPAFGVD
eukprot:TRINITY_DN28951_c0_g1_i1.p1 TRINITY_DN28951_c0_g1~~TRINITY_DN28951_c0_g1_i1.p1  ORF type:complete len:987 (+),score=329.38 TRINITY_DN28951_c0_g1_i1:66-2963(+)